MSTQKRAREEDSTTTAEFEAALHERIEKDVLLRGRCSVQDFCREVQIQANITLKNEDDINCVEIINVTYSGNFSAFFSMKDKVPISGTTMQIFNDYDEDEVKVKFHSDVGPMFSFGLLLETIMKFDKERRISYSKSEHAETGSHVRSIFLEDLEQVEPGVYAIRWGS